MDGMQITKQKNASITIQQERTLQKEQQSFMQQTATQQKNQFQVDADNGMNIEDLNVKELKKENASSRFDDSMGYGAIMMEMNVHSKKMR